jgi:hypothetical protein
MTTPTWQPSTLYAPGATVQRTTAPPVVAEPPVNASFESGDTGWTKETCWTIVEPDNRFDGTWAARARRSGNPQGNYRIYNSTAVAVIPGMSIVASCKIRRASGGVSGKVQLEWLDASMVSVSIVSGNVVDSGTEKWKDSSVTATAPATAAYVRIGASAYLYANDVNLHVDAFKWNYAYAPPIDSLVYTAVQAEAGYSDTTEPVWPETVGLQVIDNEVTWEVIDYSTVTWEASPILVSGATEPDFPLGVGASVPDNTIVWEAVSLRVEDEKCPNKPVVAIAASKIFCADDDVIAFSATVNPLDWSTSDDAGYLPFGLQTHGANPVAAMGLYRANLLAFNAAGFQMWQVDQDPLNMALLDAAPVGSTFPKALQPLSNDLIFLAQVGIRNVGIAGASTNLQAGNTGEPIDVLVAAKIRAAEYTPVSTFIPAFGQYWLAFGPEVFVLTLNDGKTMRWSRYVFPKAITDFTLLDGDLYMRMADSTVLMVDLTQVADDVYCQPATPVLSGSTDGYTTTLTWTDSDSSGVVSSFIVLRAEDGETFYELAEVGAGTLTYADTDDVPTGGYSYQVIARSYDGDIESERSNIWST